MYVDVRLGSGGLNRILTDVVSLVCQSDSHFIQTDPRFISLSALRFCANPFQYEAGF
jgi:hypothetical protein